MFNAAYLNQIQIECLYAFKDKPGIENIFIEKMQNSIFPKYFVMKGFPCQISFNIMESLNVWDQQSAGE